MSIMSPSISDPMQSVRPLNKPELMELLVKRISGTAGQTFQQKLETVFKRMPRIGSTTKAEYLSHFFRGAVLTLPKTDLMQQLKITKIYLEKITPKALPGQKLTRVAFQIENGQEKTLKMYLFASTKTLKPGQYIHRESLQQLIKASGFVDYEIYGEIIHVNDKCKVNILPMQIYDQGILKRMDEVVRELRGLSDSSSGSKNEIWDEIVQSEHSQSFESNFLDLSSSEASDVKEAINKILQNMQNTYRAYQSYLFASEAAYHGFLHGALEMNFLYRYALTIRVEPILGIGESRGDLLFLSRLEPSFGEFTGGKSWDNIPGLIEVKARGESATQGLDQIDQYLLNDLGLRTIKQKIVVAVYNPGLPKEEAVVIQIKEIQSMKKDFIQEIFNLPLEHFIEAKIKLITALKDIIKDFAYLDQIIAGQLTVPFSMSSYNLLYHDKILTSGLTTFIMSLNNILVGLHLKKDSKITIPSISAEINHIKQELSLDKYVEIQIDINNLMDSERAITVEAISLDPSSTLSKEQEQRLVKIEQFSFLNERGAINKEGLRASLWSLKNLINSEKDFQMVLKGLLMRSPQAVSLFLESNYAGLGRADVVAVFDHKIKVLELKYAEGEDDAKVKQQQAEEQLEGYKNNLKVLTDRRKAQSVAMTFNKKGSSSEILLFKEEQGFTIDRTSNEEGDEKSDYGRHPSFKELIARKNFRKKRLEEELKKLKEGPLGEYISLKITRLEVQLKICDSEIILFEKNILIQSLLNEIEKIQEISKEEEKKNESVKEAFEKTEEVFKELKELVESEQKVIEPIKKVETEVKEANKQWEIADKEKKEKRQKSKEDLKKRVEEGFAEVKKKMEEIESEIENLDATEESVGYKAKKELSESLKELQKKLVDLQEKGSSNLGILIGTALGGGVVVGGAIAVGSGEKGGAGVATGSGVGSTKEETPENVAEKKGGETDTSEQVKRPKIRTKSAKKRKLCAATRRRRDLKVENSRIHMDKSLFTEQENFSRIRKELRGLLGPNVGIRTLDPFWYMQLIGDRHDKEEKNIFEIEGVLGQSFLLGKESSYFAMLDKMTHILSRDLDAFPLSVYELGNFCECQREISREVPDRVAFSDSEPKMITTYKDLEDALNADTTNSWSKRLCIGEEEIFIRFSDGFYSYLDPKNVYVNQIQDGTRLQEVIYAQHELGVSFWSDPKDLENKTNVTLQNIDIARTAQAFSHITDHLPVLETEREQLQNQDEQKGKFNIHGKMLSRTMLYDLGLQIDDKDHSSSKAFDRTVETELTEEKLEKLFQEEKLSISVRNYMDVLDQIDVFSQDELNALIWLSQLPFRETKHGWEMERMSSLKALIHQVSMKDPLLLRYRLQLIRGTRYPQPLSFTLSFTTLASVNLNEQQIVIENYTTDSLGLISLPISRIEFELGIYENDLYFSRKKLSHNDLHISIQQFLVLKDYNKEASLKKVVIKDAEDQLWWPLIEKGETNQPCAQLIPFRAMHPIGSNICLFSEQLQQESRIAIETDSQLIALQKGSDLLLIENKKKTLNQSKGLILKYFFREPKKWENLQIHIISTHEYLTFRDINEQAKLAIELPLEYRSLVEENFVIEQPQIHNVSGLTGANLPCPKESKCKLVYLDLSLNNNLAKIEVFKSHSTSDPKDEILGLRFVSRETTPSGSTNDMSFPCPSVLRYQDLEIPNLDAFNATEIDSLQSKIDKAFLFKQSQLEWEQMLADSESRSRLMTLMVFLIMQSVLERNNNDHNLLSAYLGFSTTADILNFVREYLEEYDTNECRIILLDSQIFKGSVWLITRALLHEQNVFGNLHAYFKSLLPKVLLTKIKEKVLNTLNMEKYSDLHSSIEEFIEFHEKEKDFSSRIRHHIKNSYDKMGIEQSLRRLEEDGRLYSVTREAANPPLLESDHPLPILDKRNRRSIEDGRLQKVTRAVDNSATPSLLKSDPLPILDKHNRIEDRRLQRVTREVDANIHAISGGLRLLSYFFGRSKFIKRMQKAEQALLKSDLEPQDFIIEKNQANLQAIIDKLENKPRSYSSYIKNIFNRLG